MVTYLEAKSSTAASTNNCLFLCGQTRFVFVVMIFPTFKMWPTIFASKKMGASESLDVMSRTYRIRVPDQERCRITPYDDNPAIEVASMLVSSNKTASQARESRSIQRVRFIDEEFSMTHNHVVTNIYYRPCTSEEERALFFYSPEDYARFSIEEFKEFQEKKSRVEETFHPIRRVRRRHNLVKIHGIN